MSDIVTRVPFYAAQGIEALESNFNVREPEIYQTEVTNACNFTCEFCPRDEPEYRRPPTLLDVGLARTISERDLGGSYFMEFQLAGEPTLHPKLKEIISFFTGKVLTGMSTHGGLIHRNLEACLALDYLTISVDSIEDYEKVRPGGKLSQLLSNIDLLCKARKDREYPIIELQLIQFEGVGRQQYLLEELARKNDWNVNIRVQPDCFLSVTRDKIKKPSEQLCLNPWSSVSVQADGDVIPCCFSFGKDVVYGNLKNQSLKEIWATSPVLQEFRESHLTKQYHDICSKCYMRSPVQLHLSFYWETFHKRLLDSIRNTK